MNGWVVTAVTALLIVLSAFFVVIEFALLGARRYRLEDRAASSRSARAALRGINELTVMLAGAQLGITVCTFALGAITKPAVDRALSPVLESWGIPSAPSGVIAFLLSLLFVTFLHLVVGEMAPKSWAIAHPELAAMIIGVPSRIYTAPFRPLLLWINHLANHLVRASGIEPVERAAVGGRDADTIRHLVEHSANVGALDATMHRPITHAISLESLAVSELMRPRENAVMVAEDATVSAVQRRAVETGHLRILVDTAEGWGVVHVRDTLTADRDTPISDYVREVFRLAPDELVGDALSRMRRASVQFAVVIHDDELVGVLNFTDLLEGTLPTRNSP